MPGNKWPAATPIATPKIAAQLTVSNFALAKSLYFSRFLKKSAMMIPPIGGIAADRKVSHPTKLLYSQSAQSVPMMPLNTDRYLLGRPVILEKPKPEA